MKLHPKPGKARSNGRAQADDSGNCEPYPFDERLRSDGRRLYALAQQSRRWVNRRIETVNFDDDRTTGRKTTLDIELDPSLMKKVPTWRGRALLPIKVFASHIDIDATVTSADGEPLPQITRRHERSLAAASLVDSCPGPEPDEQELRRRYRLIRAVLDPELYEDDLNECPPGRADGATPDPGAARVSTADGDVAKLLVAPPGGNSARRSGGDETHHVTDAIKLLEQQDWAQDDGWLRELRRLRTRRSLVACVALPKEANGGGVLLRLMVTHSDRLADAPPTAGDGFTEFVNERRVTGDRVMHFEVEQVLDCESFHFELFAPKGALVKGGWLGLRDAPLADVLRAVDEVSACTGDDKEAYRAKMQQRFPVQRFEQDDPHADRLHVYYTSDSPWCDVGEMAPPEARVAAILRPMPVMGTMIPGLVASVLASFVLLAMLFTVGWEGAPDSLPGWASRRYDMNIEAAVAVLILGPTLLATFVVGQDEHLLTRQLLASVRKMLVLQAATCFLVSGVLALEVLGRPLWFFLLVTSAGSLVCTWRVAMSYYRSRRALRERAQ